MDNKPIRKKVRHSYILDNTYISVKFSERSVHIESVEVNSTCTTCVIASEYMLSIVNEYK